MVPIVFIRDMLMQEKGGFTVIELVVVILILSILSSIAVPIYNDIRTQAAQSNVNEVAAVFSSASNMNYYGKIVGSNSTTPVIDRCLMVLALMRPRGMPSAPNRGKYTIEPAALFAAGTFGKPQACAITLTGVSASPVTAKFSLISTVK